MQLQTFKHAFHDLQGRSVDLSSVKTYNCVWKVKH